MAEVGIMPPPPGVTPDFHSWTYVQHAVLGVFASTFVLATVFLALRIYTTLVIVRKLDWDILFVVLSWGTSLAFFIAMVLAMPYGFGRHLWDVTQTQLLGYFDLLLLMALTYIWPPTLTKLALLLLYLRINPSRSFQISVYITAICLLAYTIVFTVLFSGPCNPKTVGSGNCLNNIAISQAVLNILTDGVLIILPISTIHRLKMPLRQKLTVGILMGLGSAVIIASIARISYVRAMVTNPDVTWTQASAAIFSCLELNLGIICNCMARMRPFIRVHFPRWASSLGNSDTPGDYSRSSRRNVTQPPWRGDKASHSYQLESVERGERFIKDNKKGNDIHIVDEYDVEFEGRTSRTNAPRTGSTESILAPEQNNRRVV